MFAKVLTTSVAFELLHEWLLIKLEFISILLLGRRHSASIAKCADTWMTLLACTVFFGISCSFTDLSIVCSKTLPFLSDSSPQAFFP